MLVVSGLLADSVKYYNDDKVLSITYCKILELAKSDSQCDHLTTGTVSFPNTLHFSSKRSPLTLTFNLEL